MSVQAAMDAGGTESALFERIRLRAAQAPEATALCAPGREALNYRGLWNQIESVARTLSASAPGMVAVAMPDGPDLAAAILGASYRCMCAPLNPGFAAPEFEAYLSVLQPSALVASGETPAAAVAASLGIQVWEACAEPGSAAGAFRLEARTPGGCMRRSAPPDAGILLHTSATTGRSKLVPLHHGNLRAQSRQTRNALRLTSADRFLSLMPLFHLQGMLAVLCQLETGGSVVCAPGFDAAGFLSWLEEYRPTWYTASPTMHRAILRLVEGGRRSLPCPLRFVRSIGAPLPAELIPSLENALHVPVIEGYGLTEAGAVTSNPFEADLRKHGSVGTLTGVEAAILDSAGSRMAPGHEGEIAVRGPAVTRGYWNDEAANSASFRDGWLLTGDLGRFDEDGYLYVTGRVKEVVNRGGEKIMPHEIDAALAAHPAVAEAAGFGVAHPTLGEDIVAAVVLKPDATASEQELREFTAGRIAAFKVPRRILFVERIPKGITGKPQRGALREQLGAACGQSGPADDWSPLELKLAEVWKRILQKDVGVEEDFFAAGGDSLAATVMLTEVRSALAVDACLLDRVDFFDHPTIRALARIVSECGTSGDKPASALIALQPNGGRRPLFLFPDASSAPYYFRSLAKHLGKEQPSLALRYPDGEGRVRTLEEMAAHAVAVMRSVQPKGPYLLAGHCFGGIVAFEVARQLITANESVGLLAMLDTTTPGYPKAPPQWRRYLRALGGELGPHVTIREAAEHIRYLAARFRLRVRARWQRRLAVSPIAAVVQPVAPGEAHEIAGRSYLPRPCPVRVHQFLAADQPVDTRILDDSRLEWRRFARGGFEAQRVAGDHLSMILEPHAQGLAEQLARLLPQAEPARTAPLAFSAAND